MIMLIDTTKKTQQLLVDVYY